MKIERSWSAFGTGSIS